MKKTEKINRSRYTLKDILSKEWDTSVIADYTDNEIDKVYHNTDNPFVNMFGFGFNCNIILNHKQISNYRLLVLYVNFKENDKPSQKINDKIRNKINSLYDEDYINKCDSILIVVDEKISESIEKYIYTLNIQLQTDINSHGLTNEIKDEMVKSNITLGEELSLKHFKNVFCLDINSITNNLLKHSLIPKHEVIRDKKTKNEILEKCKCNLNQLPIILKTDIMCKLNRVSQGDILDIKRNSIKSGEYSFYRLCK